MEAERRQVTVLFADVVGFTAYSERAGEEAAYTLMRSLSKLMDEAVRENGGVVQGFTGDGVMAVFGAPLAFEDAPLRACRAALAILQRIKTAGPDLEAKHGMQPQLRIGLNTGAAVVGKVQEGSEAQVTVLGDTVNFASRVQSLAKPDVAYMSDATHRLVQGLVDASFAGEHAVKGKSELQKLYRLDAVRRGATRFDSAVSMGLSAFVGREHEVDLLQQGLERARSELCVIDLAAEPGMGKSRLLYEFRQRLGKDRAFVLSGSCSPDGQQTPFLPFIEVVRGSFRVNTGEAEKDVAQKLELGLTTLGLQSNRNLGLLLHLLGLRVPDDALTGLDGVLIGLRTRELMQQLLEARCQLSPVVMVIEDLHWLDSASEKLIGKIVDTAAKLRLLVIATRRPEYSPPWLDRLVVTKLALEPLATGDIRHLLRERLGVETLPEGLARQVTEKADGNPLFAEEIVSYLTERGMLRTVSGMLDFDASAVSTALPASVQSLLAVRVDRLAPKDRALLQAASVIGRRFDPELLATVLNEGNIDHRLVSMQALDVVHQSGKGAEFAFKHALVRDALYDSLLSDARTALHSKIAQEIERRSGNRLIEVAEVLAYHYGQTDRANKAFTYLSMAGSKSLNVYSLDEAETYFTAALALLDKNTDCAADGQVAEFFVSYSSQLYMSAQFNVLIEVLERYLSRIDRLEDDQRVVLIREQYVFALYSNARYREAAATQRETSPMANRLGDSRSKAYALAGEMMTSTVLAPKPLREFEAIKKQAITAASDTTDAYLKMWIRWIIGWEEISRGRIDKARDLARELMQIGRLVEDPRSIGLGLWLLGSIAIVSDSYAEALECSEQAFAVVVTEYDRLAALAGRAIALVMLRRTEEASPHLQELRRRCLANGFHYPLIGGDPASGVCKVLQGNISGGIEEIELAILRREEEGYRAAADWYGGFLCEVYLEIIARDEKLPFLILLKNLPVILKVLVTGSSRIRALTDRIMENPLFDRAGQHIGRAQMILGLLYKTKKRRALAIRHLTEARRIFSQFGQTPTLARVETALAKLGQ
jgi:class 3 adenylate cyclase/tetratricopeptide (TPR) repeat protein